MPIYGFKNLKTGEKKDLMLNFSEYKEKIKIDNEIWIRDFSNNRFLGQFTGTGYTKKNTN